MGNDVQQAMTLRQRALARQADEPDIPMPNSLLDSQALIHELHTHQIELQMQNEALQQTEQALNDARDAYAKLYHHSPAGYVSLSESTAILLVNQVLAGMLAVDDRTLQGMSFRQFIAREDQDAFYLFHRRSLRLGENQRGEFRLTGVDGDLRWVEIESSVIPAEKGVQMMLVIIDISKRKQAQALRDSAFRQLAINKQIVDIFLTRQDDAMFGDVMDVVLKAMDSPLGVFGYLNSDGGLIVPGIAQKIWPDGDVTKKPMLFAKEGWGDSAWTQSVREKKARLSNQPSPKSLSSPVPIHRYISMPMITKGEVIGLFHVANKAVDYQASDVAQLQQIADQVAPILKARLERDEKQEALRQSEQHVRSLLDHTVLAISKAIEARDPYTAGHQRRVADLATALASMMNLNEQQVHEIHLGALTHDIGKIQIPAEILCKPGSISDKEYAYIQSHCMVGYEIMRDSGLSDNVLGIIRSHHERLDGSGYPDGLVGDEVPLFSRIVAVADVVESMASHRPYRPSLGIDQALNEIKKGRDTKFDSGVVDACVQLFTQHKYVLPNFSRA